MGIKSAPAVVRAVTAVRGVTAVALVSVGGMLGHCISSLTRPHVVAASEGDVRAIQSIYAAHGLNGSFAFQRRSATDLTIVNADLVGRGRLPCSTFKIPNTLIALEEGAVRDEHDLEKWDGTVREVPAWNADQNLESAFRNSTVWFYQGLARNLGPEAYRTWLPRLRFGNGDLSAGVDRFWLEGGFAVTHEQQIRLFEAIDRKALPFSHRNIDILKRIMVIETKGNLTLRAKTGMGKDPRTGDPIGWFVGYVEMPDDAFYFSSFVMATTPAATTHAADFAARRVKASRQILSYLGAW